MEDKELINESIKVSDILSKQLRIWQKLCIISNIVWLIIAIAFGIMAYIYFYNTETSIEAVIQEGIYNAKQYTSTGNNSQLISSDVITNDNMLKIIQELNKTNTVTNK